MGTAGIIALVYGAAAPLAFFWSLRVGFLPRHDPILVLRVPAVIWIGPLLALLALLSGVGALLARALGADEAERALAWWRPAARARSEPD